MPYSRSCRAMAASRSATAMPTWSIRVNIGRQYCPCGHPARRSESDRRHPAVGRRLPLMRIALVVNEASGGGTDPVPLERAMRERGAEVDRVRLRDRGPRAHPGRRRPSAIVVAGGDGTVGAVAELAGRLGVPLGVIPAGTANDFVRANGLPLDPVEAAVLAATGQALRSARARPPRRRPAVRQRRQRRARLRRRPPGRAAQAAPRPARLRRRRRARRGHRRAAAVHGAGRRPHASSPAAPGRSSSPSRARSAAARRSARPTRRTACSTSPSSPPAHGSASPAAPGASSATRSPSSAAWSTTAAT